MYRIIYILLVQAYYLNAIELMVLNVDGNSEIDAHYGAISV